MRDGTNPIERQAMYRVERDIAAMPAAMVVQLVLWPETLTDWARSQGVTPPLVYNMLSGVKPYRRVKQLLATRLDVPVVVLEHLVRAERPLPSLRRPPRPEGDEVRAVYGVVMLPAGDALELPSVRDGSNPIERRAVHRVRTDVAAMPASLVVQLAIWDETLARWAAERRVPAAIVYDMLAGTQPHIRHRELLARRLGVPLHTLAELIERPRREALVRIPPLPPEAPTVLAGQAGGVPEGGLQTSSSP